MLETSDKKINSMSITFAIIVFLVQDKEKAQRPLQLDKKGVS